MLAAIDWNTIFGHTERLAILVVIGFPVLGGVFAAWLYYLRQRAELDLKRRMAERGFMPDEIERVVQAHRGSSEKSDET